MSPSLLLCTLRPQFLGGREVLQPSSQGFQQDPWWGLAFLGVWPCVTIVEHGEGGLWTTRPKPGPVPGALGPPHLPGGASPSCETASPERLQPVHSPEGTGVGLPRTWVPPTLGAAGSLIQWECCLDWGRARRWAFLEGGAQWCREAGAQDEDPIPNVNTK